MCGLLLMVANAEMLEKGTFPRHHFDKEGGSVGASEESTWYVNNFKNEISPIEFEIIYYNTDFCLLAKSHHVFINHSSIAIPKNSIIKLNNNDVITIGNYDLIANIYKNKSDNVHLQDDLYYLVNNSEKNNLLVGGTKFNLMSISEHLLTFNYSQNALDPLNFFENNKLDNLLNNMKELDFVNDENHKMIKEYANTNIECYEPLSTVEIKKSYLKNNFRKIDDEFLSNVFNEQSDFQKDFKKTEKDTNSILDPLLFIE